MWYQKRKSERNQRIGGTSVERSRAYSGRSCHDGVKQAVAGSEQLDEVTRT